jgi:uncharacterized protein (DUF1330 family)
MSVMMNRTRAGAPGSDSSREAGVSLSVRHLAVPDGRRSSSAGFRVAALGLAMALLQPLSPAALARGGFGHMGHLGGLGHVGHAGAIAEGQPRGGAITTPAYVLISTASLADKNAFTNVVHGLSDALLPFEGRVVSEIDNPPSWEGAAAAHMTLLQFDSADAAQRWKNSDAYRSFDEQIKRSSTSSIQQMQGVPTVRPAAMANARIHGRGRGLDPQAFEPLVKDYDQTLNKMHGICRGC